MMDVPSARSALQYRYDRRQGAHNKSVLCGQQASNPNAAWCPPSYAAAAEALMFPWESAASVSRNGQLLSRRGRSLPANASDFDTHRDSISSLFDCRAPRSR
jgi:hypothetical protein